MFASTLKLPEHASPPWIYAGLKLCVMRAITVWFWFSGSWSTRKVGSSSEKMDVQELGEFLMSPWSLGSTATEMTRFGK